MSKLILLGDGILDNFDGLEQPSKDLKFSLESLDYKVQNFAQSEVRLKYLYEGVHVDGRVCSQRPYPYPSKNGIMIPMELVEKAESSTVILSVGGRDIEKHKIKIGLSKSNPLECILKPEFREKFYKTVETICQKHSLILVTIHDPYLGSDSKYYNHRKTVQKVTKQWNEFIYEVGKKYSLPLIDVSKMVDREERSHYGTDITRLSNLSSESLSRCIDYAMKHQKAGIIYNRHCGQKISFHDYE